MKLLVVGVGGVGCEFLEVLAEFLQQQQQQQSGQGPQIALTIVDHDTVEASNLPRQRLFNAAALGRPKSDVAASALQTRFPRAFTAIRPISGRIQDQAAAFFADFAWVVMAVDGAETRRWINAATMQCARDVRGILDIGVRGFQASCRIFLRNWPSVQRGGCLECTAWLLEEHGAVALPLCQVRGRPESIQDCILWAAASSSRSDLHSLLELARHRALSFSIPTADLSEELLASVLDLTVPAVASVNAFIAAKAVQLFLSAVELSLSESEPSASSKETPFNFLFYSFEEGFYEHSVLLEKDPQCPFCC